MGICGCCCERSCNLRISVIRNENVPELFLSLARIMLMA